ncbi:hypothetical protein K1719_016726 [Acacia pycnantha]|nr:hypothetical protein K1719_040374 [Acacia pycnantha]KAI9112203.1 hypothetical protein K1719_016726 [Acacia pycnantha]
MPMSYLNPNTRILGKKDLVDYVFPDMSESMPGTSGRTSPSGHEDLELSEGWLAEIFNDAEMEVYYCYTSRLFTKYNSSFLPLVLFALALFTFFLAELHDTQPAHEQHVQVDVAELHDTQPAHEQHVVQQHVSRSQPIIVFKGSTFYHVFCLSGKLNFSFAGLSLNFTSRHSFDLK